MRKATIFIVVALLLTLCSVPVYAADLPPLPHAFYGTVEINGSQAAVSTRVEARGEGVEPGTYNPITTTERGKYGSADPLGAKLIVQGDISDGTTITFYVNGVSTGQTYPFDSGETTELPLSVTIREAAPAPPAVETNLFGVRGSFPISSTGIIQETIKATSADGKLTITIPKDTKALDKDGKPLSTLTSVVNPSPPPPPTGAHIIGLAYDFGPKGATFAPPLTLEYTYDPDALPEGVAEEDLVLAYYDEVAGEWVELDCVVDTVNNIITASVPHFSTFAIIGTVRPPEEEEVIPVGEEEEEEEEVIPVGEEEEEEEEEEVPTKPGINWALIGGIIGGVVVVAGLLYYFLMFRRRAY